MITIVNYKMGNIRSVQNALDFLGVASQVSGSPDIIAESEKLILPGVGSFHTAMDNLQQMGIIEALSEAVLRKKRPVLGICLGMQLLAEEGTEDGITKGLGWISGKVIRLTFANSSYRIPHIGFNTVFFEKENNSIFKGMGEHADFYFVHSYHLVCDDERDISGRADYHGPFVASVQRGYVFGTQFHPEKSQSNGLAVLRNFIEWK